MTPAEPPQRGRESNLFDVFRILAASAVIVGHAWPLSGIDGVPKFAGIGIHHFGVYVFFTISGYLIARSLDRDPSAITFLLRRCLRIFPALVAVVLMTVFAIGPAMTSDTNYWSAPETWEYLLNLLLLGQYELPGLFTENPSIAVNGSLWSLGVEFSCYLMLLLVGMVGVRASIVVRVFLSAATATGILVLPLTGPLRITAIAVVFFLIGSLLAVVPEIGKLPTWPGLVAAILIAPLSGVVGLVAAWVVVPYAVVIAGSRRSRIASFTRRAGDPSYGMYLWGFPVQQVLIATIGQVPLALSIILVLPAATLLGYFSWHFLEGPSIRLGIKLSMLMAPQAAPRSGNIPREAASPT